MTDAVSQRSSYKQLCLHKRERTLRSQQSRLKVKFDNADL